MYLVYFYDHPYEGRAIAAELIDGTLEDALDASLPEHTSISSSFYITVIKNQEENI